WHMGSHQCLSILTASDNTRLIRVFYFGDIIGTSSSECERPWRREAGVGGAMRLRQAGQATVRPKAARTGRRAARPPRPGRGRPGGGGGGCRPPAAPDRPPQRPGAVPPRPHPALVIARVPLLFGVLMRPRADRPAFRPGDVVAPAVDPDPACLPPAGLPRPV